MIDVHAAGSKTNTISHGAVIVGLHSKSISLHNNSRRTGFAAHPSVHAEL